jgi:hypothetical protein
MQAEQGAQNGRFGMTNGDGGDRDERGSRRGALIALAGVALLGVIGWFLARELTQSARMQDCVLSGRTNCAPIEESR